MSDENMNKQEKIYNAITEISEKYIEEAADYSFEKQVSRPGIIYRIPWQKVGIAAAVILVAGGIIVFASYFQGSGKGKEPTYVTTVPYNSTGLTPTGEDPTTPTTMETDLTSEESRIVDPTFGSDVKMSPDPTCVWNEWVPGSREINKSPELVFAIDNETDPEALYAVNIELVFYDEDGEIISVEENRELIEEKMKAEEKRLNDLGYDVHRVTKTSCGYLRMETVTLRGVMTKEQFICFTSETNCGYYMCWVPAEEA